MLLLRKLVSNMSKLGDLFRTGSKKEIEYFMNAAKELHRDGYYYGANKNLETARKLRDVYKKGMKRRAIAGGALGAAGIGAGAVAVGMHGKEKTASNYIAEIEKVAKHLI